MSTMSEVNHDSVTSRQKIKGSFLERDKIQMSSYIKDLEKTISINKEIITSLVNQSKQEGLSKRIIMQLNQENAKLQSQLKSAIRERDSYQTKLLISEQIVADYKGKENASEYLMHEKSQELLDQLNRKEYVLQNYERKFYKVLAVLKKYSETDEDIKMIMKELNIGPKDDRRITNIVEENAALVTEVHTARVKMAELESKLTGLATVDKCQVLSQKEIEKRLGSITNPKKVVKVSSPAGETNKTEAENKELKEQIVQLKEENDLIKDALRAMQKKCEELILQLSSAKEEISKLKQVRAEPLNNKKDKGEAKVRVVRVEGDIKMEGGDTKKGANGDDSFNDVSSIRGDVIVDFLNGDE